MNIHKILGSIATALIISVVCFASFIALSFKAYQASLQKAQISQNISQMIFERRFLAEEYVSTQSERAKAQWFAKQASLKDTLVTSRPLFQSQSDRAGFTAIENSVDSSQIVFNQIVQWYENPLVSTNSALLTEGKNRLSSQLSVRAQEGVSAATDLANQHTTIVTTHFRQMIVGFLIAGSLLVIILSGSFVIVWRNTSELHKQKIQSAAILNGIGDGVFVIDRNWNISLFNKAAADISGWSQAEVIGKPLQSVLKLISQKNRQTNLDY